jgi:hypothetical protein
MLFFSEAFISVAQFPMTPWLAFCQNVAPEAWQTRGNILLGLMWLISGTVIYCLLIGAIGVPLLMLIEKWRESRHQRLDTDPGVT